MNRAGFLIVLLVGSLPLVGCLQYHPRPIALNRTAAEFDSRSLTNAGLQQLLATNLHLAATELPPTIWDFDKLTWAAIYFHPSLEVAKAQWGVAMAGRKTAAGRPNPVVSVTPGYNFNATGGVTPWIPGLTYDLPIETAGKRGHRVSRAEFLAESARLGLVSAAWQVRGNLRTALIELATTERRREVLNRLAAVQGLVAGILERRFQAGAASASELSGVRVAQAKLQADAADARRLSGEARHRLAEALGVPVAALADTRLDFTLPQASVADLAEARRLALSQRADILALLAAYEASQSALRLEIAKQYPDVHLGSGYQWDQGESKWNLALTLELPVLNRNEGPIAEATARREEAAAQLLALQAKVIAEIDRASEARAATAGQLVQLRLVGEKLVEQRRLLETRLAAGDADALEVAQARLEEATAELTLLDAESRASLAEGQLEDALQIPFRALAGLESGRAAQTRKD